MNTTEMKIEKLLAGESVICSDSDMDAIEASEIGTCVRSIPNPAQVGTLDRWQVSLAPNRGVKRGLLDLPKAEKFPRRRIVDGSRRGVEFIRPNPSASLELTKAFLRRDVKNIKWTKPLYHGRTNIAPAVAS